jgi:hypothetical protein
MRNLIAGMVLGLVAVSVAAGENPAQAVDPAAAATEPMAGARQAALDVGKLAGKSKHEVADYLGSPGRCKFHRWGEICRYRKRNVEILYISGKADWITVEGLKDTAFEPEALRSLGLSVKEPDVRDEKSMLWKDLDGLKEVTIFNTRGMVDHAYIKVATP